VSPRPGQHSHDTRHHDGDDQQGATEQKENVVTEVTMTNAKEANQEECCPD